MTNANELKAAFEAGEKWVESLAVGDVFAGARPKAEEVYYGHEQLQRLFVTGALFALDHVHLWTDATTGVITRKVAKEA